MPSAQREAVASAAYLKFRRIHNRLSWTLLSVLIGLVLAFDLFSVYAKEFMGSPLTEGGVISIGIMVALLIVLLILAAALYYVRRINRAYLDMQKAGDR